MRKDITAVVIVVAVGVAVVAAATVVRSRPGKPFVKFIMIYDVPGKWKWKINNKKKDENTCTRRFPGSWFPDPPAFPFRPIN